MARIRPERRRPLDLAISALIVVVLAIAGAVIWFHSPVRHTESVQAAAAVPEVAPATSVPDHLVARWHARSAVTDAPAVSRSLIVTADGGSVVGHDPGSGRQVWRYQRNLGLCAIIAAWPASADEVLAAYRNSRGCGEVTALNGATGARVGGRSSAADDRIRLSSDSGYVVSQGDTRLETWGSNLVRGIEYGRVDAPVKPDVQPGRKNCRLSSATVGGDRIALIEHCGDEPGYRLTVLGAVLDKDEKVQQYGSAVITDGTTGPPPVVISMSDSAIAVYDGGGNRPLPALSAGTAPVPATIRTFNTDGAAVSANTVDGDPAPPAHAVPIVAGGLTTYFTGRATVVIDTRTGRPLYQVPGAIGAGDMMDGQLLLPTATGISVRDAADGRELRSMRLPRPGDGSSTVNLRVLGDVVVEQSGDEITAYGPA